MSKRLTRNAAKNILAPTPSASAGTVSAEEFLGTIATSTKWIPDLPANSDSPHIAQWSSLPSPLEFNAGASMSAPLPLPTDSNWMTWLEGMSSFPSSSLLPDTIPQDRLFPLLSQEPLRGESPSPAMTDSSLLIPPPSPNTSEYMGGDAGSDSLSKKSLKRRFSIDTQDSSESIAKRAKNTEVTKNYHLKSHELNLESAARKSRARKAAKVDALESLVASLESEKSVLNTRIAVLKNDAATFVQRENQLAGRVALLEAQLAESHRALLIQG
ncbi:hypothetical protein HDU98_001391 [Podochytrium sp. JEL0797]|nr:hypothetical protein HDU98_001391 [Podochytrium sp. JEL0797]